MILKNWLKLVDPTSLHIRLFSQYDEENCLWEGSALDVPWIYIDKKISRIEDQDYEPIWFNIEQNEYGTKIVIATISIIE